MRNVVPTYECRSCRKTFQRPAFTIPGDSSETGAPTEGDISVLTEKVRQGSPAPLVITHLCSEDPNVWAVQGVLVGVCDLKKFQIV